VVGWKAGCIGGVYAHLAVKGEGVDALTTAGLEASATFFSPSQFSLSGNWKLRFLTVN